MQELQKYLDLSYSYLKRIEPTDLIARIKSEESRNALYSPSFNHLRSFGTSIKTLIDSPSSDEGSDDQVSYPSVTKVSLRIIDTASLNLSATELSPKHLPCILIAPLDASLKSEELQKILTSVNMTIHEIQLFDFNTEYKKAALLWFLNIESARDAFSIFESNPGKGLEKVKLIKWAEYKAYYPENNFFAVILRGFSKRLRLVEINKWMQVPAVRCEIRIINGVSCGVFLMQSITDAIVVCRNINQTKDIHGNFVKAHIHPLTQRKYSKNMVETLICDLPTPSHSEPERPVDVFSVLSQGLSKGKSLQHMNPLENLISRNKK